MREIKNWWKKEDRLWTLGKALVMALLPVLCCVVSCAAQGKSIGEVYLPNSEWNDELFYFKQVESIIHYGYPQGYFGFNESHALKLSFAAWSPVLVFPWILWGLLFGWNVLSPVICNIVLLTVAVFVFVWLVKPTWKQIGVLAFLFCLYTHFVRYMLSGMPEIICMSLLIVFYGLAINYTKQEKVWKLFVLFGISGVLTLMRPYMLLFLMLPVFFWIKKSKWKGAVGSFVVLAAVLLSYALIKHYLGAEYFAPLFFTDWVTVFFEEGLFAGIHYFFGKLYWMGKDFLGHLIQAFRTGLASGAAFGGYLVAMGILLYQTAADGLYLLAEKKKGIEQKQAKHSLYHQFVIEAHLAFSFVGMFFALLLMYKLTEGSKHLLTFIGVAVFVISMMKTRFYKKAVLLGVTFAFFYMVKAVEPYDYQVPFVTEERQTQIDTWTEVLEEKLVLKEEEVPNYENVVIWLLYDKTESGSVTGEWQILHALPKGFGISCCEPAYVVEHFEDLKSHYIAAIPDGEVDNLCKETGYQCIYGDEFMTLYEKKEN